MKILHLDLADCFRGGQRQALLLHQGLRARGVDSVLAVDAAGPLRREAEREGTEGIAPITVRKWKPIAVGRFASMAGVARVVRAFKPDIVHFHEPASLFYWPIAKPARTVHTRRVSFPIKPLSVRLKYTPIDLHVGVSEEIAGILRGARLGRVATVRSAIDVSRFAHAAKAPPVAAPDRFNVLYVGAFHGMKGLDVLFDAFEQLARAHASCRLHLVGTGDAIDTYRRRLAEAGLADRAVFHGFRADTETFYPDADVVVVPSTRGEGSNGVIKEAMTAGCVVVASDIEANAEIIEHGVNGLMFRTGDAADLVRTITEARTGRWRPDPDAVARAIEGFSSARMVTEYLTLYDRLLQRNDRVTARETGHG